MAEIQPNILDKNYILNPILRLFPKKTLLKLINPLHLSVNNVASDLIPVQYKVLSRDEPLFHENDSVDKNSEAYFILTGKVRGKSNGHEFEIDIHKGVAGEMALLTDHKRSATCFVDSSRATFYTIKKQAFNLLFYLHKNNMIGYNLRNAMLEILLRKFDEKANYLKDSILSLDAFTNEHDYFVEQKVRMEILSHKLYETVDINVLKPLIKEFQTGIHELVEIILKNN